MAKHDGTGYPIMYCLLSTATSTEIRKCTKALNKWASRLRDMYNINPDFCHLDKDMGEIGMAQGVWKMVKLQLCWWHMRKALRERLAKRKLSTTPYNGEWAQEQFGFIDLQFCPAGNADPEEYEGRIEDSASSSAVYATPSGMNSATSPSFKYTSTALLLDALRTQRLSIKIPAPSQPAGSISNHILCSEPTNTPSISSLRTPKLIIKIPANHTASNDNQSTKDKSDQKDVKDKSERHTFCAEEHRQPIIDMVEWHFCTHPLIPSYSHPTPTGICKWAVREIYGYCVVNDLHEVWVYLWENWYRQGRWELWAQADYEEIPVLKTTMIMESQ